LPIGRSCNSNVCVTVVFSSAVISFIVNHSSSSPVNSFQRPAANDESAKRIFKSEMFVSEVNSSSNIILSPRFGS